METKKYRECTKEFKLEALELLENNDRSASEVERELGQWDTSEVAAAVQG